MPRLGDVLQQVLQRKTTTAPGFRNLEAPYTPVEFNLRMRCRHVHDRSIGIVTAIKISIIRTKQHVSAASEQIFL